MVQQKRRAPGRPRIRKSEISTKQLILQKATPLFLNGGYQKVSIDDVAAAAGMTKASVYYYFSSKADLFKVAMVEMMKRITVQMDKLFQTDKPLRDQLKDVTLSHLRATTTLDIGSLTRETKTALSVKQQAEMNQAEDEMYRCIERAFERSQSRGDVAPANKGFAAHALVALLKIGNMKSENGLLLFPSVDEAAEEILDAFWHGFFTQSDSNV
ncbi:MAG: TetR/AcrR family transcriptional regulator [Sporolactobacillus sp.]